MADSSRYGAWLARCGHWMLRHGAAIRYVQWTIALIYAILVIAPAFMQLPGHAAHLWDNFTLFAQFIFWGIWWPFVLLSMVLFGRLWCGILCPEGALAELASKHGRHRPIPRWLRWAGWPFVAFVLTTLYGQMVSVYQYPKAVLLVLGGSTLAALVVGFLYGREKRVWCKYLCPVNGVFGLLARLAPIHYKVDEEAWRRSYTQGEHGHRVIPINCAPLVPLRTMQGSASCHMCSRCSGHREAISLSWRSPSHEVVQLGKTTANGWDTLLILYGLMGIAVGAFHWTTSPWFIALKQALAGWLMEKDIWWPFATNAPWFIFTHYPDQNDVFSWLDGGLLVVYIVATSLVYGTVLNALLALAARCLGRWRATRLHHLAQSLIPLAGCGVFLGLSALTVSLLKGEHIALGWVNEMRFVLLAGVNVWCLWLAWGVVSGYAISRLRRSAAMVFILAALGVADSAWWLLFWYW